MGSHEFIYACILILTVVVVILGFLVKEINDRLNELESFQWKQQDRNENVRIRLAELKNEIDCKADKPVPEKVAKES